MASRKDLEESPRNRSVIASAKSLSPRRLGQRSVDVKKGSIVTVVGNGRHFTAFKPGEMGCVVSINPEKQNCEVLFRGKSRTTVVAVWHLSTVPTQIKEGALDPCRSADLGGGVLQPMVAPDPSEDGKVEGHRRVECMQTPAERFGREAAVLVKACDKCRAWGQEQAEQAEQLAARLEILESQLRSMQQSVMDASQHQSLPGPSTVWQRLPASGAQLMVLPAPTRIAHPYPQAGGYRECGPYVPSEPLAQSTALQTKPIPFTDILFV